jgi:hypothetical protein
MVSGIKSAEIKIAQAAKHLRAIKRYVSAYSAAQPHKVTTKPKGKKKLTVPKSPPKVISILAGEMIYQMRSALDHLAYELVKRNPNVAAIDPKWYEHCQFPLRINLPTNCTCPLPKETFARDLPGIPDEVFKIIEKWQPYYGPAAVANTNGCLRILGLLSNIDKHRHLNLIRPRVRQSHYIRFRSGVRSGGYQLFDRGSIIDRPHNRGEMHRPVYVNRRYRTLVCFDERDSIGEATNVPIEILLNLVLYQLQVFILPTFQELLGK